MTWHCVIVYGALIRNGFQSDGARVPVDLRVVQETAD